MKYRMLDQNGDYILGANREMFHSGSAAVAQAIKTRLKLLLGEWWENVDDGLPLFEQILGSFGGEDNLNGIDLIIQERILSTPDVLEMLEYERDFDKKTRRYTFKAIVATKYGDTEIKMEEVM